MAFLSKEQGLYLKNILCTKYIQLFGKGKPTHPRSIMIVKWDEFGDMANATHVFELLKTQYPESKLTLLCKPFVASMLNNNPYIDELMTEPDKWHCAYDIVVELRGTEETLSKSWKFKPKWRVDRGTIRFKNKGRQKQEVETNYEIIKGLIHNQPMVAPKLYPSEENRRLAKQFVEDHGLVHYVVMHAGARKALRRWKEEKFVELVHHFWEAYKWKTILVGGKEDAEINERIRLEVEEKVLVFPSKHSLLDFAALVEQADLFVGNESGPLHIASCMGAPIVGLYGPGVERVFYPFNENAQVVHYVLDCNPCDQIHCVTPEFTCMDRIEVAEVKAAAQKVIKK